MRGIPPLAEVHLEALDEAFAERLRAAPRPEQDRLLAEADLLRIEDADASSWRALSVYRALVARLEEGGPIHLERAAWTACEAPARDAAQRRIATLALAHPLEDVQVGAGCVLAVCEWQAGEFPQAEQRLRALLPRVRGRGDALEIDVLHGLASLYSWQRRELEALVLARRALEVADSRRDLHPVNAAHALSALADAHRSLEDPEGLTAAAERMHALSTRMSEPDAGRLRRQAYAVAHEASMLRGDLPAARDHLAAALTEQAQDLKTAGHDASGLAYYEARLALRLGDLARATALLEEHHAAAQARTTQALLWDLLLVELWLRTGRAEAGVARAARMLARMAEPATRLHLGTGRRLRYAERLGELLEDLDGDARVAELAYRDAADAAYDRLGELERCLAELPELLEPSPEDREALARYRSRFLGRHRAVLDHLRDQLTLARERGALPAWATAAPGGFAAVCAWCRCVRDPQGRWLPLGHFVATSGPHMTVTHGICERCRSGVEPELPR